MVTLLMMMMRRRIVIVFSSFTIKHIILFISISHMQGGVGHEDWTDGSQNSGVVSE